MAENRNIKRIPSQEGGARALQIVWFQSGALCDTRHHLRAALVIVVKRKCRDSVLRLQGDPPEPERPALRLWRGHLLANGRKPLHQECRVLRRSTVHRLPALSRREASTCH